MPKVHYQELSTPLGKIRVAGHSKGICRISFYSSLAADWPLWFQRHFSSLPEKTSFPLLEEAAWQLREYFSGKRSAFDLPLDLEGTSFQLGVWEELLKIPYGSSLSYAGIARRIGNPRASRAVGAAAARNPLPIIVPCHRVIGSSGKLVGFTGGLPIKERLLELEKGAQGSKFQVSDFNSPPEAAPTF